MKKLPLLARDFEDQSIEEFYKHAKDLAKPHKPKMVKLRKKKSNVDDDNSGLKPVTKTIRKTKKNVGAVEAT